MAEHITSNHVQEIGLELSEREAELETIKSQLVALTRQHDALTSTIFHLRAQICPIRRVPQEILAEIFIRCLPTTGRYPAMSSSEAPLVLGRVCRAWRDLAQATPALWDSIHIVMPILLDSAAQGAEEREVAVRQWLTRSGGRGISISLAYGPRADSAASVARAHSNAMRYLLRMMEVLLEFKDRWITFRSTFDWRILLQELGKCSRQLDPEQDARETISPMCPRLQEIYLASGRPIQAADRELLRDFRFPASLRRVAIRIHHFTSQALQQLHLPWSGLTHLFLGVDITWVNTQVATLEILKRCPQLVAFSGAISDTPLFGPHSMGNIPPLSHPPLDIICLPKLRVLEIYAPAVGDPVTFFFMHISVPGLQHVTYHLRPSPRLPSAAAPPDPSCLPVALLPEHAPTGGLLESFSLMLPYDISTVIPLLIDYLHACTSLRRLQIKQVRPESELLGQLAQSCLAAGVEEIHLTFHGPPVRPAVSWPLAIPEMPVDTSAIKCFLDTLLGQEGASGMSPRLQKAEFAMSSWISREHEGELTAYACAVRRDRGVACDFAFLPRMTMEKAQPWDGIRAQEAEARTWFAQYC